MAGDLPHTWFRWLSLVEFWYNTSYHSSIHMSPFESLYRYLPPVHVSYFPNDSRIEVIDAFVRSHEDTILVRKRNITRAQHRIKMLANKKRTEKQFDIGEWVYLKFQPY